MMKEISWINWAKFICLIFVYLDHSLFYLQVYDNFPTFESFYHPFFVNIFFFMSGYLLFRKQLSSEIIKIPMSQFITGNGKMVILNILNKIVLPTILFSTIMYIPKKVIRGDDFTILSFVKDTILGGSIWFTCALAVAELLVLIMLLSRQRNILFYVAVSIVLSMLAILIKDSGFTILSSETIPWFYKSGMIATLFLSLGGLYNHYEYKIDKFVGKYYVVLSIALGYIIMKLLFSDLIRISLFHTSISILGLLIALASIYVIVFITKRLRSFPVVNYLGRMSLGLYLLSGGIPNIMGVIFIRYGFQSVYVNIFLVTLISFIIGVATVNILNRVCPIVFNFKIFTSKNK